MSMQRVDAACDTRESQLRMRTKETRMKTKEEGLLATLAVLGIAALVAYLFVNRRPRLTPPSLGRSMTWLADRRRDPKPINTVTRCRPKSLSTPACQRTWKRLRRSLSSSRL